MLDQIHALTYWIVAPPSKKSCQSQPFVEGLIQIHILKPPLYQNKHSGGIPTGVHHKLRCLVDQ